MIRSFCFASVLATMAASGAAAQEQPAGSAEPQYFVVIGVADNDQLNLRATASPTGMLIGRLPNGALTKNLGCGEVGGIRWCKVASADNEKLIGWAAARYLQDTAEGAVPALQDGEAAAAPDEQLDLIDPEQPATPKN